MVCQHLRQLEEELISSGVMETFRGQAWTQNCREWVYFDCCLELPSLRRRLALERCVVDHENDDRRTGRERGFVCTMHWDAVIGGFAPAADTRIVR